MMLDLSVKPVVLKKLCTGCGTCVAFCPKNAIIMELDKKMEIFIPIIDQTLCNNCGICHKVCPGHEFDYLNYNIEIFGEMPENIFLGNFLSCYYGHSTDSEIRFNSASGGIVTQILIYALEEKIIDGALVSRMKKENPLIPEPFIARTREEIIEASKSKYCPVPANIALKTILNNDRNEHYAIVGVPCHIQGIRKAMKMNNNLKNKIKFIIGLWCSKTCNFRGTEFVLKRYGVNNYEIKKLSYRGKGWPGGMTINLINGENKFIGLGEYWDSCFAAFAPQRCHTCIDSNSEFADISCGDFRGKNAYTNETIGNTAIISRTKQGDDILNEMSRKKRIKIERITDRELSENQWYFVHKKNGVALKFDRFLLRPTPNYNYKLLEPRIIDYLWEISGSIQILFASNCFSWGLLIFYTDLILFFEKHASNFLSFVKDKRAAE